MKTKFNTDLFLSGCIVAAAYDHEAVARITTRSTQIGRIERSFLSFGANIKRVAPRASNRRTGGLIVSTTIPNPVNRGTTLWLSRSLPENATTPRPPSKSLGGARRHTTLAL
jgi:hypothetical protein